jgi:hypothetical protein
VAFFCSGVSTLSASERGLRAAIDAEVGSTALQGEFDRFLSELREVKCKSHALFFVLWGRGEAKFLLF